MIFFFFSLFSIAIVITVVLGVINSGLYHRLSTRIAALIIAAGPVALLIFLAIGELNNIKYVPPALRWAENLALVLGGPLVLGLLAARSVRRPLHQFNEALASLEHNNYKVRLEPSSIREFDEAFKKFNNLIGRLHREEKLRKDLISDTSHELNTPLTAMIGQLTAIQEGKHTATKERIATLREQAERLAELVQQLDAYTKARIPDAGKPADIFLRQLCEEVVRHFSLELQEKNIAVKLHIAEDFVVHANLNALRQILTNLIQNSLRYSEATEITITATAHALRFSDNGEGVPPKSLPYLFERFYRVDKSRSRETGGLGLGLAIVRELAEGQGMQIRVEDAHPGLTFVLKLRA